VVDDGDTLRIVHRGDAATRSARLVDRMRGRAGTRRSTDDLMRLLRGD
jgi:Ser/Thr protein kinase RdoA (MazF antagonist)